MAHTLFRKISLRQGVSIPYVPTHKIGTQHRMATLQKLFMSPGTCLGLAATACAKPQSQCNKVLPPKLNGFAPPGAGRAPAGG